MEELSAAIGIDFCGCWVEGCGMKTRGEACEEGVFDAPRWEETGVSCSILGKDGFDDGVDTDDFVLSV